MSPIGYQIAQLRRAKGQSQAVLAAKAGLRQGNLSRIESGRMDPTVTMLCRLSAALEMKPSDILRGIETQGYEKNWTTRARIERLAKHIVDGTAELAGDDRELAELLSVIRPPDKKVVRVPRYRVYQAWARVRQLLTLVEIRLMIERIRDAEMRKR